MINEFINGSQLAGAAAVAYSVLLGCACLATASRYPLIMLAVLIQLFLLRLRITLWQVRIYGLIIRYTLLELWNLVYHSVNHVGCFYSFCAHNGLVTSSFLRWTRDEKKNGENKSEYARTTSKDISGIQGKHPLAGGGVNKIPAGHIIIERRPTGR